MTRPRPSRGQILLLALVFMGIFSMMAFALLESITAYARAETLRVADAQALALAEAGLDEAVAQVNASASYTGETDTTLGGGTFSVVVSSVNSDTKSVLATGYVPDATNPVASKSVRSTISISSSVVSFRFGVQVGAGGLSMSNGSSVDGNMFSDGSITGSGVITGDATVAAGTQTTPDQSWTTENVDEPLGETSANAFLAQSFTPSATGPLNYVSLNLKKVGAPGDLAISIVADNGGVPGSTVLTSGAIPAASVTNSYGLINATLSTSPTLNAGQTYWIVASMPVSASNYFVWGGDSANGYTGGTGMAGSGSKLSKASWTALGADLDFETFGGGVVTELNGITVDGSATAHTLANCTVGGDAYYQTISGCSVAGTQYPDTADTAPIPLPVSDAQVSAWESIAASGGVHAGSLTLSSGGTTSIGPEEIDGDLTVDNGTAVELTGPVWVRGNISLSNNATVTVSSSVGSDGLVLFADVPGSQATEGTITIGNGVTVSGNGTSGSSLMLLSTNSGSDAIQINNNGGTAVLYASNGTVDVANNAHASQITAYGINMSNNTTVTYTSGLQSQTFSNGPGGSWAFVPGTYAILP